MMTHLATAAVLGLTIGAPVLAQQPTREDAVAMAERVRAHFEAHGLEATSKALMDTSNADFHSHDGALYAYISDLDGVSVAHGAKPTLVGKSLMGLTDPDGVKILEEHIKIARTGEPGWVDYRWENPSTKQIESKTSYVLPLDDENFVGAGVYK